MPVINKQKPAPQQASETTTESLKGIVSARDLKRSWMKVLLYGRNRVGKSRLSAEWPKPFLAIACEPRENGGADTLIGMEGVDVAAVGLKPLKGEMNSGSNKILDIYEGLKRIVDQTGVCPYNTISLDVTALQDIILAEIMGWDTVEEIIKRPKRGETGGVGLPQFMARAEQLIKIMRRLKDLPCNTIFVGQEKDHNPTKDEEGNLSSNKMVLSAQEKSWMSVYLGQAAAIWLQNACPNVHQLYMDAEVSEVTTYVDVAGVQTPQTVRIQTGKYIRRLRCSYHPNYASGITAPDGGLLNFAVPEYIETNSPKEMYDSLLDVCRGKKTKCGKYL